jgi:hypothetical protein
LAETKRLPLFIFAGKRRLVGGKVIPLPFPASPAFTCYRCLLSSKDQLHLRLHRLQCPRLRSEQRDITAACLERALGFIGTTWPRKSRMAGLLARSGRKVAEAQGYTTVARWLRQEVYPRCFRSAIADLGKPTRHRFGRQWLKTAAGSFVEVAPTGLSVSRLEWWLKKETQRRAEPVLLDLLHADALLRRPPAITPNGSIENRTALAYGQPADEEAQAKTVLCELYRLCDPDADGPLGLRNRRLLHLLLEHSPMSRLQADLQLPSRGAVYTAISRLVAKLPEDLRAALGRGRSQRTL